MAKSDPILPWFQVMRIVPDKVGKVEKELQASNLREAAVSTFDEKGFIILEGRMATNRPFIMPGAEYLVVIRK